MDIKDKRMFHQNYPSLTPRFQHSWKYYSWMHGNSKKQWITVYLRSLFQSWKFKHTVSQLKNNKKNMLIKQKPYWTPSNHPSVKKFVTQSLDLGDEESSIFIPFASKRYTLTKESNEKVLKTIRRTKLKPNSMTITPLY